MEGELCAALVRVVARWKMVGTLVLVAESVDVVDVDCSLTSKRVADPRWSSVMEGWASPGGLLLLLLRLSSSLSLGGSQRAGPSRQGFDPSNGREAEAGGMRGKSTEATVGWRALVADGKACCLPGAALVLML